MRIHGKAVSPAPIGGPLMSVTQLEQESGVSHHTWRTWMAERRILYVRLGRRVFVVREDYEAMVRAGRIEAQAPIRLDAPGRRRR